MTSGGDSTIGVFIVYAGMMLVALTLGLLAYLDDRNKRLAKVS